MNQGVCLRSAPSVAPGWARGQHLQRRWGPTPSANAYRCLAAAPHGRSFGMAAGAHPLGPDERKDLVHAEAGAGRQCHLKGVKVGLYGRKDRIESVFV